MKFLFLALFFTANIICAYAQMTIGSLEAPASGTILQLKNIDGVTGGEANATKGLALPRVALTKLDSLDDMGSGLDKDAHIGLMVYNTGKDESSEATRFCPGLHVWNGESWIPLVPYPNLAEKWIIDEDRVLTRGFEYLDPNDPTGWPADKEADRQAGKYALGRSASNNTPDLIDNRPNDIEQTYTTSRFYVGYKTLNGTFFRYKSLSCDPLNAENWIYEGREKVTTEKYFVDGVWMTQNLNAKTIPDGTPIGLSDGNNTSSATEPRYAYPNYDANNYNPVTALSKGLLYNWFAASNGENQTTKGQRGSSNNDVRIQGICPQGWHLPSAQEWTDLENGLIRKSTLFSTFDAESSPAYSYDQGTAALGLIAKVLFSSEKNINGLAPIGESFANTSGGFDAIPIGHSVNASTFDVGGAAAYRAASIYQPSSFLSLYQTCHVFGDDSANRSGVRVAYTGSESEMSVRCMKDYPM